jgi:dTDP-glucose pyrophosphorylase
MDSYKELIIRDNLPLKEAMRALDNTAMKVLFVVDHKGVFVGSLTDGDIRRWILKGGALKGTSDQVAFKNAYVVSSPYNLDTIKDEMKERNVEIVPVLDETKHIVEMLYYERLFQNPLKKKSFSKLDIPVVIMAGGRGTRLDPFTRILPKPLIPIGEKTILEIIIDKFIPYGVNHFYLSVNYKAAIIKSYFEDLQSEYTVEYIEESKPLGTAGALFQLQGKFETPVLVTNCDIIIEADYADLAKHHYQEDNDITIVASIKHYSIPYGVCEIENGGTLKQINEKPEYSFLINTGMYILSPTVLNMIPQNEFFHITHLVEKLRKEGRKVGIYPISENAWVDTGEWEEYKKAIGKLNL